MIKDQDTVLVELVINDQGDVQLRLVDPPSEHGDNPLSEEVANWLKRAKPMTLDDLQRIMASSPLPPDPSTISICNMPPP